LLRLRLLRCVLDAPAPVCLLGVVLAGGWRLGVVEDRRMPDGQICGGAVEPWGSGVVARCAAPPPGEESRGAVGVWPCGAALGDWG
jgi:hypothetical protein